MKNNRWQVEYGMKVLASNKQVKMLQQHGGVVPYRDEILKYDGRDGRWWDDASVRGMQPEIEHLNVRPALLSLLEENIK